MSRDTGLKLAIMSITAILAVGLLATKGMSFSVRELAGPLGVLGSLGPCAVFYHRRQTPQFVMTLLALIQFMVFTSCFTVAMYGVAALGAPLADELLASVDQAMGLHVPAIVQWANEHPQINRWLMLAYHSVTPQTLIVVLILGFLNQRRPLEAFVLRYMICLMITLLFFALVPAECPFTHYGFAPSPHQAHYLEHLQGVRSGERTIVSLTDSEGLVTFPSFHTSYAILLTAAFWRRWRLFVPFAIVNSAVVAATLTSGWHYGIDILGGIAAAIAAILIANRLQRWLYAESPTTSAVAETA
ncbi:MAG: phosphatase PAP2 family protein [Planctomycetes bacterium]|nr:phosphatase PAP2 family protein [Planctomycetota bacterium]